MIGFDKNFLKQPTKILLDYSYAFIISLIIEIYQISFKKVFDNTYFVVDFSAACGWFILNEIFTIYVTILSHLLQCFYSSIFKGEYNPYFCYGRL